MSSIYVENLRGTATMLEKEDYPYSAKLCFEAADRMERMEELIVSLHEDIKELDDA